MTDEPIHPDDLAIFELLTVLERQPGQGGPDDLLERPASDDSTETLTRLYVEVLGLVPYELAAETPPPAVKARLMTIVAGDETQDVEPIVLAALPPLPAVDDPPAPLRAPLPVASRPVPRPAPTPARGVQAPVPGGGTPIRPVSQAPGQASTFVPTSGRIAPVRRPSRWPLALAAVLILSLLGLSGYLYQQLQQKVDENSQLVVERNQLIAQEHEHAKAMSTGQTELTGVKGEMENLQARMALITSPGVEISPLHPTGQVPMPPDAYGMLFVAADHQHWDLAVRGLNPSGSGRQYQLWFIAPQGAVSGGTFTAAPGTPINLSSAHMPAGTRAVIITLEPEAGTQAPSGPEVLRAAAPVKACRAVPGFLQSRICRGTPLWVPWREGGHGGRPCERRLAEAGTRCGRREDLLGCRRSNQYFLPV